MQEIRKADVVIVGGGASGLAAAVELRMSSPELAVLVIEKKDEPGRKLRATGSGRCNITNTKAAGYDRIMEFFGRIGLATRTYENGLVYPYSESASDVVKLLVGRALSLGVDFICSEEVTEIRRLSQADAENSLFEIESVYKDRDGVHKAVSRARFVILACGGKAGPSYGTTGDGYGIAKKLGHSIVSPVPALSGVECEEWNDYAEPDAHMLAGTRTQAELTLYKKGKPLMTESGEVQFTRHGLSGICVFNLTRHMRFDKENGESLRDFCIKLNLFPDFSFGEYIEDIREGIFSCLPIDKLLTTLLKEPVAAYVMELIKLGFECGEIAGGAGESIYKKPVNELSPAEIKFISELLHNLEFYPIMIRGWRDAQVTMGGVATSEIDEDTSESKIVRGLYITGELADRDFPCGGFNLSNAWITGLEAADDILKRSK